MLGLAQNLDILQLENRFVAAMKETCYLSTFLPSCKEIVVCFQTVMNYKIESISKTRDVPPPALSNGRHNVCAVVCNHGRDLPRDAPLLGHRLQYLRDIVGGVHRLETYPVKRCSANNKIRSGKVACHRQIRVRCSRRSNACRKGKNRPFFFKAQRSELSLEDQRTILPNCCL